MRKIGHQNYEFGNQYSYRGTVEKLHEGWIAEIYVDGQLCVGTARLRRDAVSKATGIAMDVGSQMTTVKTIHGNTVEIPRRNVGKPWLDPSFERYWTM